MKNGLNNAEEYWNRFCESGKIEDFLNYSRLLKAEKGQKSEDESNADKNEGSRA